MITLLDENDVMEYVQIQLSSLSTLLTADGLSFAVSQAEQELGWSYPITNPTQVLWIIKRATRHSLNILKIASANKFKYKTINLQNRFEHFQKLVEDMDKEFEEALTFDLAAFSGVDSFKVFGTKIDAGFAYDIVGTDLTYDIDQYVNFSSMGE